MILSFCLSMISGQTHRVCPPLFRIMLYGETLDQKAERSNSTMHKINTRVTTVTARRVVQLMPRLTHQSSAQLMITGTMISSCNELALLPLEHDPEKHALGPRPDGWAPVFRKGHAQTRRLDHDPIQSDHDLISVYDIGGAMNCWNPARPANCANQRSRCGSAGLVMPSTPNQRLA